MSVSKYGDWSKAGMFLQDLAPRANDKSEEFLRGQAENFKKVVIGHIDRQDINWTALSKDTIRLKKANKTIHYVESGNFKAGFEIRKIPSPGKSIKIFSGFSPWKKHTDVNGVTDPDLSLADMMNMNEYGYDKVEGNRHVVIPPRPILRPSYDEISREFKADIAKLGVDLIRGG